jgi:hypothetical protein
MKKIEIEQRCEFGRWYPSINVKVYQFAKGLDMEGFACSEETFNKAMGFAFESAQERFWENALEKVKELWPWSSVYSSGRSGGYLVVKGLHLVDYWDAIMISKWAKLVKWCKQEIAYLSSKECVSEEIFINEWNKKGAELYNFVDENEGNTVSIPDLKAKAIAQGFGPIIRK